ncbi:hypothetical protein GGR54DRAFT_637182 [Hypoxylon sp. NC1633]|nr:hypothetical protein GGR54DRAFT_637182 [Hypoxylon sp. NC1633]
MAEKVTIEKGTFINLLVQTKAYVGTQPLKDLTREQLESVVYLPKDEFEQIVAKMEVFGIITRNLLHDGWKPEDIKALSSPRVSEHQEEGAGLTSESSPFDFTPRDYDPDRDRGGFHVPEIGLPSLDVSGAVANPRPESREISALSPRSGRGLRLLPADRTVTPLKLTCATYKFTIAEATQVIRGGPIADIQHDRLKGLTRVTVAFVFQDDAERFYQYAGQHGVRIYGEKIDVGWSKTKYSLIGPLVEAFEHGATRNLVIQGCRATVSEDQVREDLRHISNCRIIKFDYVNEDCFIKLNSIGAASLAMAYLKSQDSYKKFDVEYDEDECDQPLS